MNMHLKPGLWQQQTMKLAMTQELTQAIALLQYSAQELTEFLEAKTMENPFIQLDVPEMKALHSKKGRVRESGSSSNDEKNWVEHVADHSHTLLDYLRMQLSLIPLDPTEKRILDFLLYNMDDNGYMTISIPEAAQMCRCPEEKAEEVLEIIRELEPAGVGAFHLQDCLLLQLQRMKDAPELVKVMIKDYFMEFADKNWRPLAKKLNVDVKDIQSAADFIQKLNPKPGARFHHEQPTYVKPDVTVAIVNDTIEVHLLEDDLPKVVFQKDYFNELAMHKDPKLKQFMKEKEKDYVWLLKSLEQRKQTIQRVGLKIVEKQRDFFFQGPSRLQTLNMKEIAEELEIHESTVSRAVRGKYMQTPYGTYELKFFFPSGIASNSEEGASAQQVKSRMTDMVNSENKQKPLSDQEISNRLKEEGFSISRRTVAKYRDQLNIASSSKRKRYD
ncbi:RNA polymerase sigma-54 factor [Bacillus ectoiniformans]|uniref:RNA polymerase factor sigma-54 n=1 Tax=Bacillus ectoiniformans TaxID=1494429 RepID=UPI0019588D2D|nr:RNA polymerase factor sigma-54 [Bacillus ectoiniformans]MBM7648742.1 RNA polymerase sigma-54 factor [Bacillus ectoiniformans]